MRLIVLATLAAIFASFAGQPQQQTGIPLCSTAQHDAYTIAGPDGATYKRWHPQVDQRLHCAYQHEHGSDPGLALPSYGWPYHVSAADVAFGYVGAHHGMVEPHAGFKVFAFDDRAGHLWRIAVHQGSSGAGRVCERYHEIQVLIIDSKTWEELARVGWMGDFGAARSNKSGAFLIPSACPNQGPDAVADGSTGVRQFGVYSEGFTLYDPWRLDDHRLVIPIDLHSLTIWPQSINDCQDLTCDVLVNNVNALGTVNDGADRFFQLYPGMGIEASTTISGTFYTDPLGRQLLSEGDPHAIKQYIRPGAAFTLLQPAGLCRQWGVAATYHCGGFGQGWPWANYAGAIGAPN